MAEGAGAGGNSGGREGRGILADGGGSRCPSSGRPDGGGRRPAISPLLLVWIPVGLCPAISASIRPAAPLPAPASSRAGGAPASRRRTAEVAPWEGHGGALSRKQHQQRLRRIVACRCSGELLPDDQWRRRDPPHPHL
jgi:hypothetical protein